MMKRFGADAEIKAAMRADELLAQGDRGGERIWIRIAAAIRELAKSVPDSAPH